MIPDITDPLGKYWEQPSRESILLDVTHAVMAQKDFERLHEYSTSIPTGKYEGKMWRCQKPFYDPEGIWYLVWYGPSEMPDHLSINYREIILV